ncbi:MAG: phosphotransferase [Prosthecobacter sp.]|uniref:phosphotransferase enzyme family protein n=1 Tax=Prosthecobacter sp. TaxID=1965333 RepID=UPI0025DC4A65|nr:phosphotransferase [Prosthecobacter sp.]MCF7786942.1 phosphotransferase [Prosthecobacter sp.]
MIREDHLTLLCKPFGLASCDLKFVRSNQNYVYMCRRKEERCILRISTGRHRSCAQVEAELAWIEFLAAQGVTVCRPIPALNGETCVTLNAEGTVYIVTCFEHAPGRKIMPSDIAPPIYEKLGGLLAQLHSHALKLPEGPAAETRAQWHESRLLNEDVADLRGRVSPGFLKSLKDLMQKLRKLPAAPGSFGLIHADACLGNCFLDGGQLWIFDFDNCEHGHFVQDFATILYDSIYCRVLNQFADEGLNDRIAPLWAGLWKGYSRTGPLPTIEALQLKHFFLLREAVIYIHYHRTLNVTTLDDSFKAGLEVMRRNVEAQTHQVDFVRLAEGSTQHYEGPQGTTFTGVPTEDSR